MFPNCPIGVIELTAWMPSPAFVRISSSFPTFVRDATYVLDELLNNETEPYLIALQSLFNFLSSRVTSRKLFDNSNTCHIKNANFPHGVCSCVGSRFGHKAELNHPSQRRKPRVFVGRSGSSSAFAYKCAMGNPCYIFPHSSAYYPKSKNPFLRQNHS